MHQRYSAVRFQVSSLWFITLHQVQVVFKGLKVWTICRICVAVFTRVTDCVTVVDVCTESLVYITSMAVVCVNYRC